MKNLLITLLLSVFVFSLQAQQFTGEQVFLYTDKDNYVAGEEVLVKFLVKEDGFRSSSRSKVGYIELCDTQKPHLQIKLALEEGEGNGSFRIPGYLPSGVYQLSGYTRYMRNQGEDSFFTTYLAIMNMERPTESDPVNVSIIPAIASDGKVTKNIQLKTDNHLYTTRNPVVLHLEAFPDNIADLVISVYRNDSLVTSSDLQQEWKWKDPAPVQAPLQWLPEQEGHIITGKFTSPFSQDAPDAYLSLIGGDITLIKGQPQPDNTAVSFNTLGVYGTQEVVLTAIHADGVVKMEIESPFHTALPTTLPELTVYMNRKALTERYIAAQLSGVILPDSTDAQIIPHNYFWFSEPAVYHLDEYTRFPTLSETFIEYLRKVRIRNIDNKRVIWTFLEERKIFTAGPALALLDGVLISDHERLIEYDPQYIQTIRVYDGRYLFGGEVFDGIVSFETYQKDLPFFQLPDDSHLFQYECPVKPKSFNMPDYSDPLWRDSRKPDFRHTLYWNPNVGSNTRLTFYTSDLTGDFRIVARGFTTEGRPIYGATDFCVK